MADQWDEINTSFNSNIWDYKTVKEFIGTYQSKKDNVGAYSSSVYNFTNEKGVGTDVWGTTSLKMILDDLIAKGLLVAGKKVKMVYEGRIKNPKSGRQFHSFKVYLAKDK
jgi:hypothetical protein